jgi:hypothetical protein
VNLLGTITFAAGAILIYSAVKDKTPVEVFKELQGGAKPAAPKTSAPAPTRAGGGPGAPIARLRTGN